MSEKQITIRMPAEKLKLWLRALRLKKNAKWQAKGFLYRLREDDVPAGYCCLGVAQQVISGGIECGVRYDTEDNCEVGDLRSTLSFPSAHWLKEQGIEFFNDDGGYTHDPYLPLFGCSASEANDSRDKTFLEIADAIEDCAEGY